MKEYVVFGDYKGHSCPRADFKILDFVAAESPSAALNQWLASRQDENPRGFALLEEEVYVMQVDSTRWVFDLTTRNLSRWYTRT